MPEFPFDQLRRRPDVEASNLFAVDASDRLILDEATSAIAASPTDVAVIGDRYGALTLGAIALGASGVRVHQDALLGERALAQNAQALGGTGEYGWHPLGASLLEGARVVLLQLPRALAELEEWVDAIARYASPDVVVIAGGRIKHMTLAMNDVFLRSFDRLDIGRARQKSRTLQASGARTPVGNPRFPTIATLRDGALPGGELLVSAHGAAFAGASLDIGTRYLLGFLPEMRPARDAIDLGSGTGVLASALASARPDLEVTAIDQSCAAVLSTSETATANDLADRIHAVREDALFERPPASADLIVCNPPFHSGATVHAEVALRLLGDAARVLRPGGELWTVFNSHLGYRAALARAVGPTEVAGRNDKFTVTVSRREP
ncbi:class I SAM-dependent methyltransferase [Herbiconiux sp. L3-i23]|uniref:class I SAM-dependent methyltransferase n=1 Tax=Herbiconiux sp. L3-i23 TaxID=2905871 RepID=UPI00205B50D6|nr:class I SAM-dependent methyltransferase [Herbiconiux sp. L3-i23]BDI23671.1 16S RNA G1207 methylase RsmC [Herbiconiux sp. L3-i23]